MFVWPVEKQQTLGHIETDFVTVELKKKVIQVSKKVNGLPGLQSALSAFWSD